MNKPHRRKVTRVLISVSAGVLAAASVAVLLWVQVSRVEASGDQYRDRFGSDLVEVVVAAEDVPVGEKIGPDNTVNAYWLESLLPEGAVRAGDAKTVRDKRAGSIMLKGEPVTSRRLTTGTLNTIEVAEGLSAVSIRCDAVTALGGEIEVGMQVDVLGSMAGGPVDRIVSGAQILSFSSASTSREEQGAVSSGFRTATPEVSWVTLAVPSELAQQLVSVYTYGSIHLVLPGESRDRTHG